ncbi:hypothetical protein HJG60_007975 [Phyllostomus discolor]|uniref:Uncharacterized protein n=1 Tax=Phyllostomus discolor TaxID=89673 RepID=A0A834EVU7_9CHIR|nr:hypothetical protein HJG60_007975 [Phyllostomus discolor]
MLRTLPTKVIGHLEPDSRAGLATCVCTMTGMKEETQLYENMLGDDSKTGSKRRAGRKPAMTCTHCGTRKQHYLHSNMFRAAYSLRVVRECAAQGRSEESLCYVRLTKKKLSELPQDNSQGLLIGGVTLTKDTIGLPVTIVLEEQWAHRGTGQVYTSSASVLGLTWHNPGEPHSLPQPSWWSVYPICP